ncbi:unnamed protein product [Bursaphelenchus okinawaensis]|uniref:Uncharacterized protein n=1 Tax=Bursaphelenchus okinawaensis TaxID=465554 RepID=A0A811JRX7_9BILA|nr:unnamed protein product [Bursaphelenchus okinawaensis]CAG9080806.1 unnamed protein product [Bursaphelenchus okinawaensis]
MIDPKGFTTNDLIMLNLKQEKTLEKADVRECGSINVLASTAIPLPPVIARQQKRQIDTLFDQANVKEEPNPLSFVHIEEYRDNTFLTANAEGELTTNMEQVKTDHSTEKEKESGSFVNNDIPP